ncbi:MULTISPECIES: F0F1 ATP synthase subunit A [Bacillales]|uniref:F0F1 ATP synthase subunit A n=1 Tax=Bacillales TaxID=1385 RepID=UPI0006A7D397|nr:MULTISPECIES: F0F1 ATP synthase subunit A [Bacillales]MBC9201835.1 F0F1 ATP synthase subunit A [Paenibacillus sp. PL91]OBZ10003.1 ATP synthase F0 subunit A [Bacillus sp. FJAT-26390]
MHEFPVMPLGPFNIDISTLVAIVVSVIVTFLIAKLAVRNLSVDNPSKMQNFLEWVVDFVHNFISSTMPANRVRPFISLGMTLIMFIFVSNLLGLPFGIVTEATSVNENIGVTHELLEEKHGHVELAWWKSPTADLSVTAGLALIVFVIVHFLGLKQNRKHYLKHYFHPFPIFFPVNIIETISKPVTLALRLFANIFAGEVLIATILMLGWYGTPFLVAWQGFSLFVGGIQAFLFTILTMVYISQAAIHDEEH